jgi:hypothetical protein
VTFFWLPPVPSVVGVLSRYEGPTVTAEITAVFLDDVLRGRGDPTADLAGYGVLTAGT